MVGLLGFHAILVGLLPMSHTPNDVSNATLCSCSVLVCTRASYERAHSFHPPLYEVLYDAVIAIQIALNKAHFFPFPWGLARERQLP